MLASTSSCSAPALRTQRSLATRNAILHGGARPSPVACRANPFAKLFGGNSGSDKSSSSSNSKPGEAAPSTSGATSLVDNLLRGEVESPEYPPYTVIKRQKDYVLR